ncbi:hypothetical protein H7F33_09425 [Pedobacter sp. PAMC26386]|nr:hypothetical protein H7F33_09425 [Pedobacter sp. PAMC26386]
MNTFLIRTIKEGELDELIRLIEEHTAYEKATYDNTQKKPGYTISYFKPIAS